MFLYKPKILLVFLCGLHLLGASYWCPRPESNRYALRRGIFFPLRLSPPVQSTVRGLEHAFTIVFDLRCPPSALYTFLVYQPSLARRWLGCIKHPGLSPNLTGSTSGVSSGRLKLFKSLVSTYSTTRALLKTAGWILGRSGRVDTSFYKFSAFIKRFYKAFV